MKAAEGWVPDRLRQVLEVVIALLKPREWHERPNNGQERPLPGSPGAAAASVDARIKEAAVQARCLMRLRATKGTYCACPRPGGIRARQGKCCTIPYTRPWGKLSAPGQGCMSLFLQAAQQATATCMVCGISTRVGGDQSGSLSRVHRPR